MALAAGGYLLAYALLLDRGSRQERLASLAPTAFALALWAIAFISLDNLLKQRASGRAIPARTLILGSGIDPIEVERRGETVLAIRPEGGFLAPAGSPRGGPTARPPAFDRHYVYPLLDRLFRGTRPMRLGQRIELTGVTVEITALTADGRPAEATFHFATRLDDPILRWIEWRDGVYVPFALPAVGEAVTLPAATVPES